MNLASASCSNCVAAAAVAAAAATALAGYGVRHSRNFKGNEASCDREHSLSMSRLWFLLRLHGLSVWSPKL